MSSQTLFITKGSTDVSVDVALLQDAGATNPGDALLGLVFNSTGLVVNYREGATGTVTSQALSLQTVGGAHLDGGFVQLNSATMPGSYRLDLPDTLFSGPDDYATVSVSGHADLAAHNINVILTDIDFYDAVRAGLTALPNADADAVGGLPISDAGGLDMDTLASEVSAADTKLTDIQGPTFNAGTDALEAIRDRGDSAWAGGPPISASGTAVAGSTTTLTEEAGQESPDNSLQGQLLHITAGTGAPQSKAIEGNVFATGIITIIGTWPGVSPNATSIYQVTPADIDEIIAAPTSDANAQATWDLNTAGHTGAGTFGEQLKNDLDAVLSDTSVMEPKLGAPVVDLAADIAAVKSDSAAILIDTTEIGSAGAGLTVLATQASVNTIDANVDAVLVDTDSTIPGLIGSPAANLAADIAAVKGETAAILVDTSSTLDSAITAIKAKTDLMTFTVANQLDANVQSINDNAVVGDGNAQPWDGS